MLVSAGFDAHREDHLAGQHIALDEHVYYKATKMMRDRFPRIISVLEGGYKREVLQRCCALHMQALV